MVAFWKRRAYRLLPALVLCLSLLVINNIRTHINTGETIRATASAMFYVFNLVSAHRRPTNPLGGAGWGALWSLSVEEQFYVLWPIPLLWAWRRFTARTTLIVVGLLGLASAIWCTLFWLRDASFLRLYLATDTRAQSLFTGAALAVAWHAYPQIRPVAARASKFLIPACVAFLLLGMFGSSAATTVAPGWMIGPGVLVASLLCGFIVLSATEVPRETMISKVLNAKVAVAIGKRSYGLYLFHVVASAYFLNIKGGWLLSAAVTFVLAWVSYAVLELPVMRGASARAKSNHGVLANA